MKTSLLSFIALGLTMGSLSADTLTVTNTQDDGAGSLRSALANATAGDVITFDLPLPAVIGLTTGELLINKSLTVEGPGANDLTIELEVVDVDGGGARVLEIGSGKLDVSISGLTLSAGHLLVGPGGGMLNSSTGQVTLTKCAVTNNLGTDAGEGKGAGGIYNSGVLTITDSTISGNMSEKASGGPPQYLGGGIGNSGTLTLVNCTISDNSLEGMGGGIANVEGTVTITACTIAANSASSGGGGIANHSTSGPPAGVHLQNSIVADNDHASPSTSPQVVGAEDDLLGGADSLGYNLIGSNAGANVTPTTGDQIGTPEAPIDAKLGPLQDNGGPTQTTALLPGSPAIDKGNSDGLTSDQRGMLRPVDDATIPPAVGGDDSDIGAFEVAAAQLLNISSRAEVLTGEDILDVGFIVSGSEAKKILIRGVGPSLGDKSVSDFLPDPLLQLNDSASVLFTNDDWKDSQDAEIEATGLQPNEDAESAIVATLEPGAYTAILSGKDGVTGVALVEVYDLGPAASHLGNLSTRSYVGQGDNVLIAGVISGGGDGGADNILFRAVGPSLSGEGVVMPLANPSLELHDGDGTVMASNDDWRDTQELVIEATGLAPTDNSEAAILAPVPAGAYTAVVRGMDGLTGTALVEMYNLTSAPSGALAPAR